MADKIKLGLAALLVIAGIAGFYLLQGNAMVLRVVSVLAGLAVAAAVAWLSEPGRRFAQFGRESVVEAQKVAWPSRKETLQTTGVVVAFVVVMAIFLWLVDAALMSAVKLLMGRGD
ncbi:MAG: preprotein translocase subunit SecE [Burkholderiales bacterium]